MMLKKIVLNILAKRGLTTISKERLRALNLAQKQLKYHELALQYPHRHLDQYHKFLNATQSQLKQELFALLENDFKSEGFFVEFGAADGFTCSNTYLLEKEFHWKGILAEPGRSCHQRLRELRDTTIDERCVWSKNDETLNFLQSDAFLLSTVEGYGDDDAHQNTRKQGQESYDVKTVTLQQMLKDHNAPKLIDYLSIDTEGSEYEILNAFDFDSYQFKTITVEHNFTAQREQIYELLTKNGYKRVHEQYSSYDDWYVLDK